MDSTLLVTGYRPAAMEYAGSPLPCYDQWMVAYGRLLLPLAGGIVGAGCARLFRNHNEHILATTKLLTLVGYWLNGYWDLTLVYVLVQGTSRSGSNPKFALTSVSAFFFQMVSWPATSSIFETVVPIVAIAGRLISFPAHTSRNNLAIVAALGVDGVLSAFSIAVHRSPSSFYMRQWEAFR
jgi:hypothetical protein